MRVFLLNANDGSFLWNQLISAIPYVSTQRGSTSYNPHPSRIEPQPGQHGGMCNPFGVGAMVLHVNPGCAARPRASLWDCFAVR
jgi:hypothetical protein